MKKSTKKPKKVSAPRILVHDFIRYYRNGPLEVMATFISRSVFGGQEERVDKLCMVPQPDEWDTDEPVLDAIRAEYPKAEVSWRSDAEPAL